MDKSCEETGTVRRIDNLGKITIPKELRDLLNIKEGCQLEIGVGAENNLIIKKYSPMNTLREWATYIVCAIGTVVEHDIILTDSEKVITANKKKYMKKVLSGEAQNFIYKREIVVKKVQDDSNMINIFSEFDQEFCCELIVPIIKNNDVLGSIIVLAVEDKCFDNDTVKVCKAFSEFLSSIIV
ncbi:MAG: hypothetical protein IJX26_00335 [Clostridia bacterium]|nr:hypothetical protein [Clostridia bacterium]